jgi:LPXTG-site transpeptidase (sortase) family protein
MKLVRYAVVVALVVSVAACSHPSAQLSPPNETSPPAPSTSQSTAPGVGVSSVAIPSIELNDDQTMQVDKQSDGSLGVPPLTAPRMIGWDRQSPVPGDAATGSYPHAIERAVLVGHINANHVQGAFADLAKVKIGAKVRVARTDGDTATFTVSKVLIVDKSKFPTESVYGHATGPELVMITCGPGDLDTVAHNYLQQTLVWAKLVSLKPSSP